MRQYLRTPILRHVTNTNEAELWQLELIADSLQHLPIQSGALANSAMDVACI